MVFRKRQLALEIDVSLKTTVSLTYNLCQYKGTVKEGVTFEIVFVFAFAIVFVFVIIFLLVRPCPLITLMICIKGHKSLESLFEGGLQLSLSLSLSWSLSFCWSGHVTSLSECSMVVFFNNVEERGSQ